MVLSQLTSLGKEYQETYWNRKPKGQTVADYVLQNFNDDEFEDIEKISKILPT